MRVPRYSLFGNLAEERDVMARMAAAKPIPEEYWAEISRRRRRHAMEIMMVCLGGLAPWTVYLALTLPTGFSAHYWRLAWAGFDVLLLSSMAGTAYLGWRRRQAVIAGAIVTATLLICDAWFDIALDLGTRGIWTSLASAAFIELPLAAFFLRRAQLIVRFTMAWVLPESGWEGAPPGVFKIPMLGIFLSERHQQQQHQHDHDSDHATSTGQNHDSGETTDTASPPAREPES